jgi:hypothetical protein
MPIAAVVRKLPLCVNAHHRLLYSSKISAVKIVHTSLFPHRSFEKIVSPPTPPPNPRETIFSNHLTSRFYPNIPLKPPFRGEK